MRRKIIELGNNCMVSSLPIKWVRKNNLEKGDELDMTESEGKLIIDPLSKKPQKKEISVNFTGASATIIRTNITAAYSAGYDTINVKCDTKKQYSTIKDIVQNLIMGFDITKRTDNSLIIDNVAEPSGEKAEAMLRRMFLTTLESFEEMSKQADNKFENFDYILEMSQRVTTFKNFLDRNASKHLLNDEKEKLFYTLRTYLAMIQNEIFHCYQFIEKYKITPSKEMKSAINALKDNYDSLYKAFFRKDIKTISTAVDASLAYKYDILNNDMISSTGKRMLVLHYLSEILWLTSLAGKTAIAIYSF